MNHLYKYLIEGIHAFFFSLFFIKKNKKLEKYLNQLSFLNFPFSFF
jgi:hypothetical protein